MCVYVYSAYYKAVRCPRAIINQSSIELASLVVCAHQGFLMCVFRLFSMCSMASNGCEGTEKTSESRAGNGNNFLNNFLENYLYFKDI